MRVLTQVQLASSPELNSNSPMDVGWITIWVGSIHTGGKSGLNPG